jgi:hypothetical protein
MHWKTIVTALTNWKQSRGRNIAQEDNCFGVNEVETKSRGQDTLNPKTIVSEVTNRKRN